MSRQQVKVSDKVTFKNTRDGLVEHNAVTDENIIVGKRDTDLNLRGKTQEPMSFSQVGKSSSTQNRAEVRKHSNNNAESNPGTKLTQESERPHAIQPTDSQPIQPGETYTTQQNDSPAADKMDEPTTGVSMDKHRQRTPFAERMVTHTPKEPKLSKTPEFSGTIVNGSYSTQPTADIAEGTEATAQTGNVQKSKPDQQTTETQPQAKPDQQTTETQPPPRPEQQTADAQAQAKPVQQAVGNSDLQNGKRGKLQFNSDETAPNDTNLHHIKKLKRAQAQSERATGKLEKAKNNLPTKKVLRKTSVIDENTGVAKKKLQFEKKPISQREHIKGAKPLRPVKGAVNTALVQAHRKLYQVESENVSVKAAHRAEMLAETGIRSAFRHRKIAPYKKVARLERAAQKKAVNLSYRHVIAENPKLQSNIFSRAMQKRKIKKDYAKAARKAQKAAKKAGSTAAKAGKAVVGFVKRHPITALIIILIAFLLFSFMSLFSAAGGLGSGSFGGIIASSYLAEDADMLAAEAAYAEMEAGLQYELDNYSLLHPGYDEYQFNLDDLEHDPYVLISILSSMHEGIWTLDDVQGTLTMLFERQYILTETVSTEVRYRDATIIVSDPITGAAYLDTVQEAYDYSICTVTLKNFDLSHLPIYIMGETGLSMYALYMTTFGNRPDLFPLYDYPNASTKKEYGHHDIPPEYLEDETFATIIQEAERYLGYPYVWGGSNPSSSFDCSLRT